MDEQERKPSQKVKIEQVDRDVRSARAGHEQWYAKGKACATEAFAYYNTQQRPSRFPRKEKIYAQINRVKENQDAKMGILLNSPINVEVEGRGKDFKDRERTKIVKATVENQAEESSLNESLIRSLFDYNLTGVGHAWPHWNPHRITSMGNLGCLEMDWLSVGRVKLDPRKRAFMDTGRFNIDEQIVTRLEFESDWAEYLSSLSQKKVNVEKLFNSTRKETHWDYLMNKDKSEGEQKISIIKYQYWRILPVNIQEVQDEQGNPLRFPKPEFRIAFIAGDEVFADEVSPLDELRMWDIVTFYNSPIHDSAYAGSDFASEREIQDMINVLSSLLIDAQLRQRNAPWIAYKGSIKNKSKWTVDASETTLLEWDAENIPPNLNPDYARPYREPAPPADMALFKLAEWFFQKFQNVSLQDVLKGNAPPGVKSGYGINLLQQMGMQPSIYSKQKLGGSFKRLGHAAWKLIVENLVQEMELPVKGESGEPDGIWINKVITPATLKAMYLTDKLGDIQPELMQEFGNEPDQIRKMLKMVTVRLDDERLGLEEYAESIGINVEEMVQGEALQPGVTAEGKSLEFIYNDISYGNFDVSFSIDEMAEQGRLERMEKAKIFMPMIEKVQAPFTALEYGLEVADEPKRYEIVRKSKEESVVWQYGQQFMQAVQMQQQGKSNAEQPKETKPDREGMKI